MGFLNLGVIIYSLTEDQEMCKKRLCIKVECGCVHVGGVCVCVCGYLCMEVVCGGVGM